MPKRKFSPLPSICRKYKVATAFDWFNTARPKIIKMLAENEYGFIPPRPAAMTAARLSSVTMWAMWIQRPEPTLGSASVSA